MNLQSPTLEALAQHYEVNLDHILNEFKTFLSFASVSSDPSQSPQVIACANWVKQFLTRAGFHVDVWQTKEHPVLFGQDLSAGPDKPTLLIYNHYDVQPVDPLELWGHPPFEPTIKDNTVYARGAQDNKGQCFYVLTALQAIKQLHGRLPINVKVLIEGNEETGSAGLAGILKDHVQDLKADYLFIVDVGIPDAHTPSVTVGLRGIVAMDVTCKGSLTDLHSGCHGGLAFNPIHALVQILSKLRDETGHILVPGFYEDVEKLPDTKKKAFSFDFDPQEYERNFGIPPTGGERSLHPLERNWMRPTLEINGISGGFSGPGVKTVIPSVATAKISCRLVPGQNPDRVAAAVTRFLESQAPPGIKVTTHVHAGGGCAIMTDPDSTAAQAVAKAFSEVFAKPSKYILEGASIPIVALLEQVCKGQTVLLGLGLPGDCIHAPNEHFSLDRLKKGYLIIARSLEILGTHRSQT